MICKKPVILVVEDDHEMNELECELLSLNGFQTKAAYNGSEAVDLCDAIRPDIVLMDVMLPVMDGFEACRRICGNMSFSPPVVMLTALDGNDSEKTGHDCGATVYLTKPFDVDEVIDTLKSLAPPSPQ